MYTIVAIGVMVYALVVYQMRAKAIRLRTGAPYDDRLGPTILCLCLLGEFAAAGHVLPRLTSGAAAIVTNFILKFVFDE